MGAIEAIDIAPSDRKRSFSAAEAVSAMTDPRAASGYLIELFEAQPLGVGHDGDALGFHKSFLSLQSIFLNAGDGLVATLLPSPGGTPAIEALLTSTKEAPRLEDRRLVQTNSNDFRHPVRVDQDVMRHDEFLRALSAHPLVRRIRLPLLIQPTNVDSTPSGSIFSIPARVVEGRYPKVGVIDTGIAGPLEAWVEARHDFLQPGEYDPDHGTMVAGVLVGARGANGPALAREEDGCSVVDLPLLPSGPFLDTYGRRGFEAFLEELEVAIAEARETYGVRIFNMSLNVVASVDPDTYSIYAARLDDIQDRLGVLIVNSAGNLSGADWRPAWPGKVNQVLAQIATRTVNDTIFMPCESVRTIAVGALNPPGSAHMEHAPATYTRWGPGLRVGVKPDVAHFGGTGDAANPTVTHLISCAPTGEQVQTCGTSFAAPLVAKTLAALDIATAERLAPRTLRAFMIHNSIVPAPLSNNRLKDVARRFVGFGQPADAASMLETGDHAITLVFESRLSVGVNRPAILRFPFAWPAPLVDQASRACRGRVKMTLVYDPPIDQAFGAEFIRVNLSAHLKQRQPADQKDGTPSFHDQVSQAFLPRTGKLSIPEKSLIQYGLKWWPTKRYEADFSEGVGNSTEWRVEVESVVRAEATFPAEGIPFSLVVTIEDEQVGAPIFDSLRQSLIANRVQMQDIRTAIRVRPTNRT
ncbi:S8 family peptidase [Dongia sp.]|uniref:S8 family peptidase n=1 Tax=Dongia sp. TaxID=1977262 RepID=UPI0035B1ED4D